MLSQDNTANISKRKTGTKEYSKCYFNVVFLRLYVFRFYYAKSLFANDQWIGRENNMNKTLITACLVITIALLSACGGSSGSGTTSAITAAFTLPASTSGIAVNTNIVVTLTDSDDVGITTSGSWSDVLSLVTTGVTNLCANLIAWDVDFFADPRKGDEITLVVEKKFVDGKFYSYGKVLAVNYNGKRVKQKAFYFKPTDGYYDEKGKSLARNFLKSPVMYSRISSKFGRRRHPVTHKLHNHLGTDFAAPTGTPVWALASGRVTKRSYNKYNGNYIAIKHSNGYSTYYLHLSRFAKGLRVGKKVKQKELIGYVGTTGRSTGPHLHLSVKYGGRFINPLKLKRVKRTALKSDQLAKFMSQLPEQTAKLNGNTSAQESSKNNS